MSRKIERLINLTIALLATKRYLTKTEIFRTVDGYLGEADSKERMFERDKDDLRSLGIDIEVGSFDPLFHDEAGYRIRVESYQLDLGSITSLELALLSLAAEAWQGAALSEAAQSAIMKLKSIGVPTDTLELPGISHRLSNSLADIAVITGAIVDQNFLHFTYISTELSQQVRIVIPFSLATKNGLWYLACIDQAVQEVRIFRLDRIIGPVVQAVNREVFDAPADFDFSAELSALKSTIFAIVDVRKGKGLSLRVQSVSVTDLGEWDQLKIPVLNFEALCAEILWHGSDAFVHQPVELQSMVITYLEKLVANHG